MQNPKNAAAGFGTRWVAYIIDCLLIGFASGIIGFPIMLGSLFSESSIWTTQVLFDFTLYAILMYCIRAVYFVVFTYSFGKTPGKMLLRIQVESKDGEKLSFVNVLFRETIGRFLSGFILYVGYLIALSSKEHLALHDMLCDTRVCYTNLTEVEKVKPIDMRDMQPLPHIVVVDPQNVAPSNVEQTEQVWTMPQQMDAPATKEQGSMYDSGESEDVIDQVQQEENFAEDKGVEVDLEQPQQQEKSVMPEKMEALVENKNEEQV